MWSSVASTLSLALALAGPAIVAFVSSHAMGAAPAFVVHIVSVASIAVIVLVAFATALRLDGFTFRKLGFEGMSWSSVPIGLVLALFLIVGFGPFAYWMVTKLKMGPFDAGLLKLSAFPSWYLVITVVIVASSEELLYRAYAVERLATMTGSYWTAGALSVLAFGIAHVPLWGWGPALTTFVSGAIMTLVYLWRRDVVMLMIAHVVTDLYGIVIAPSLTTQSV